MTTAAGTAALRLTADRRRVLQRRVRLVAAGIIVYNVAEGIVASTAGTVASSTALVSFGLDSCVEVLSAAAIAWQFSASDPERREKAALRTVAVAFFALAAYVSVESILNLVGSAEPELGRNRDFRTHSSPRSRSTSDQRRPSTSPWRRPSARAIAQRARLQKSLTS